MDLKRYRVNNIQEALQLIKKDLGPEAVIVSTRQVKEGKGTFGLFGKTVLEVTAALDQEQKSAPSKTPPRLKQLLRLPTESKIRKHSPLLMWSHFAQLPPKIRNRSYFLFKRMFRN